MAKTDVDRPLKNMNLKHEYNHTDIQLANMAGLRKLLGTFTYKKGWGFDCWGSENILFRIAIMTEDSTGEHQRRAPFYDPKDEDLLLYDSWHRGSLTPEFVLDTTPFGVYHTFAVPDYKEMNEVEIERYLLDRIIDVEKHEAMEFFKVKGVAVYMPDHKPGGKPYQIRRKS